MIELAELYEKGLPPVAGGALNQTRSFLDAVAFIAGERAHWKAALSNVERAARETT